MIYPFRSLLAMTLAVAFSLVFSAGRVTAQTEKEPSSIEFPRVVTVPPNEGAVEMTVFHNQEAKRGGFYANERYPAQEVAAQLNYLFASREMMRAAGFTKSPDSIDALIRIYGFEVSYYQNHRDYPPHFHIMTTWNHWDDVRSPHFILSDYGKILSNHHHVRVNGVDDKALSVPMRPGIPIPMEGQAGEVRFTFTIQPDGSGLTMTLPNDPQEFRLSSGRGDKAVYLWKRENAQARWILLYSVTVEDDPDQGIMTIHSSRYTPDSTQPTNEKEIWHYDPTDGKFISAELLPE